MGNQYPFKTCVGVRKYILSKLKQVGREEPQVEVVYSQGGSLYAFYVSSAGRLEKAHLNCAGIRYIRASEIDKIVMNIKYNLI